MVVKSVVTKASGVKKRVAETRAVETKIGSKWRLFIVCAACFLTSSCNQISNEKEYSITLRLSHVFNVNEELAQSIELVADRINTKTDGAVRILTYPGGQIATYKDGVEMVSRGAYFISVEDPSYIGDYVPEFTALVVR